MKTTLLLTVTALSLGASIANAQSSGSYGCEAFQSKAITAQRELDNFNELILRPLESQLSDVRVQINHEVDGPRLLAEKIRQATRESQNAQQEVSRHQSLAQVKQSQIDELIAQAEAAEARGDAKEGKKLRNRAKLQQLEVNQHEKAAARIQSKVELLESRIETWSSEKKRIETEAPHLADLQSLEQSLKLKLSNQTRLKLEKQDDVRIFRSALDHCVGYTTLKESVLQIRANGCDSRLPYPQNESQDRAQRDARSIMGCNYY